MINESTDFSNPKLHHVWGRNWNRGLLINMTLVFPVYTYIMTVKTSLLAQTFGDTNL